MTDLPWKPWHLSVSNECAVVVNITFFPYYFKNNFRLQHKDNFSHCISVPTVFWQWQQIFPFLAWCIMGTRLLSHKPMLVCLRAWSRATVARNAHADRRECAALQWQLSLPSMPAAHLCTFGLLPAGAQLNESRWVSFFSSTYGIMRLNQAEQRRQRWCVTHLWELIQARCQLTFL